MMTLVYVAIGGAIGSVMRYLAMTSIGHAFGNEFPYSTLVVNVSGSLVMGLLIGWLTATLPENAQNIRVFAAVGILGGYTTFSAFSLDAITLMQQGKLLYMAAYILFSVILSLGGLIAGLYLMRALS